MHLVASIGAIYASSCFHWSTLCIKLLPLAHFLHQVASIGAAASLCKPRTFDENKCGQTQLLSREPYYSESKGARLYLATIFNTILLRIRSSKDNAQFTLRT